MSKPCSPRRFCSEFFEIVLLVSIGLAMPPSQAYSGLTYIYTYIIVGDLELFTAGGLVYLKVDAWVAGARGRHWFSKSAWQPAFDPLTSVIANLALKFYARRRLSRPFSRKGEG